MHIYVTHVTPDDATVDGDQSRMGAADWPTLTLLARELKSSIRRTTTRHGSLAPWFLRLLAGRTRVSPMSSTWLHLYETERAKHEPDV
jgi:hypothetical protein